MDLSATQNNYAFIDGHNLYLNASKLPWEIDYLGFRHYLTEIHGVRKAFVFLGFISGNESVYEMWEKAGFTIIFKDAIRRKDGSIKGNCDVDLTLRLGMEFQNFDQAILVTGDSDFECVLDVLLATGKLKKIIAVDIKSCSYVYQRYFKKYLVFLHTIKTVISKNAGS